MILTNEVSKIAKNFDSTNSDEILSILEKIKETFHSNVTKEYLSGKIREIKDTQTEKEKKQMCLKLKPYFEWYLQAY